MRRRFLAVPALLALAVAACAETDITPPLDSEVVLSEVESAQLADLNEYVDMIRSGVDPTSPQARAVNRRIMDRFPVRQEVLDVYESREGRAAAAIDGTEALVAGIGEPNVSAGSGPEVEGSGPAGEIVVPDDVGTIGAAIAGASPGETIIVLPGVYYECIGAAGLSDLRILGIGAELACSVLLDGDQITVAGFTVAQTAFAVFLRFGSGHAALANTSMGAQQGITFVNASQSFMAGNRTTGGLGGLIALGVAAGAPPAEIGVGSGLEDILVADNLVSESLLGGIAIVNQGAILRNGLIVGNTLVENATGILLQDTDQMTAAFNSGFCNGELLGVPGATNTTDFANFGTCPAR